ncbi:hypothetical protein [[Erwinia] mediterraneensis]|uniref:hypothetical protein n=1 Tax=[Erwinia] mediterraneensis TaxID=2161819 RepID=UPI0010300E19|nr:hypothetical protein [[Erwinia] mediterraneensis]
MTTKKWFVSYEIEKEVHPPIKLHTFVEGYDGEVALDEWITSKCERLNLEKENINILQFNLI